MPLPPRRGVRRRRGAQPR